MGAHGHDPYCEDRGALTGALRPRVCHCEDRRASVGRVIGQDGEDYTDREGSADWYDGTHD